MSSAGTLLVVDDSDQSRSALRRVLEGQGYAVQTADGGADALDLVGRQAFDLVLLDVMMQDVDGLAVLQALRRTRPATELPVIMATANDRSEDIVAALKLGANDYVTKPLDLEVLLARIQTQLTLKRAVERAVRLEQNLAQRNADLEAANERMEEDLKAAARIQQAFLPQAPPACPAARFAWCYKPCARLDGDTLNVFALDERHVALYVLDVSGHGVASALLAVALSHLLAPTADPTSLLVRREAEDRYAFVPPAELAAHLTRRFPWDPAREQFFTILYGILDVEAGELRYVSAGHPGPVHLRAGGAAAALDASGLPIGLGSVRYEERRLRLQPGERLYLFSDGAYEALNGDREPFGKERLCAALTGAHGRPLEESVEALWAAIEAWCGAAPQDDVSVLALEYAGAALADRPAASVRVDGPGRQEPHAPAACAPT